MSKVRGRTALSNTSALVALGEEWGWFALEGWLLSIGMHGYAAEYAIDMHW